MKGNEKPYSVRVQSNIGEDLFEMYCDSQGYKFNRLGFDEQNGYVNSFPRLNPILRNMPDYVVDAGSKTFVVNVKGTANFKKTEFELLPALMECFGSEKAPLVYAFCFQHEPVPIFVFPNRLIELYNNSVDKAWDDGVVHRNLKLKE
jgi:hypothetical protein